MQKSTLHDLAKFGSGLILADFLCGLYFYLSGNLPVNIFNISFNEQSIVSWMIFDVLLLAFLIHYGWNIRNRSRTTREKKFHLISGVLFSIVALLHLSRILFGASFVLGSWEIPYWVSGLGTIITAFLAWMSFGLAKQE